MGSCVCEDACRPGGQLHPQDFIDNHGDVVVQLVLALIVFYLLFQGKKQPRGPRREAPLTEKVDLVFLDRPVSA